MGHSILVADDSITIQKVIGLTFANEDFELESADNGDEALQKAESSPPDLIIADTNMPGLSGYDLCEQIRANGSLAHIPVILLTGTYEVFDEDRAQKVGASDHLTKPFESQVLIDKVRSLLAQAAAAPSKTESGASEPAAAPDDFAEIEEIDAVETVEPIEPDTETAAQEAIEAEPAEALGADDIEAFTDDSDEDLFAPDTAETASQATSSNPMDFSDLAPGTEDNSAVANSEPVSDIETIEEAKPLEVDEATEIEPEPSSDATPGNDEFANLAAETSEPDTDADAATDDWNMGEFESYLADQETESGSEPIAAPPSDDTADEIDDVPVADADDVPESEEIEEVSFAELDVDDTGFDEDSSAPTTSDPDVTELDDDFEESDGIQDMDDSLIAETGDSDADIADADTVEAIDTESETDFGETMSTSEDDTNDEPDVFAEFAAFDDTQDEDAAEELEITAAASAAQEVTEPEINAEIEPEPPSIELSNNSDEGSFDVEHTTSDAYEQTFETEPTPDALQPAAGGIDEAELKSHIRQEVDSSLSEALDASIQEKIESAVNDAVEKAVAKVMDELRRRLS